MLKTILNFVLQINLNFTGALDKYDDRNFPYEAIAGADMQTVSLPTRYVMQDNYYTDQGYSGRYKYGCVAFSTTNAINEILPNFKEDPIKLFNQMVSNGLLNINTGAYVIDGPKTAQKLGWINGFTQVSTIHQMKHSIFNYRPIVSGSNMANWDFIKKSPYILQWNKSSYGHAFCIVGYDDELNGGCFICENSYGTWLGDKGRFYIKYEDVDKILFNTRLSLFTDNSAKFSLLKEYIKQAKKDGYIRYTGFLKENKNNDFYILMQEAGRITFGLKQNLISKQ